MAGAGGTSSGAAGASTRMIAAAISAGTGTACALVSDGSVWCWGANNHGELGDGATTDSDVPVHVKGVSSALAVQVGGTWNSRPVMVARKNSCSDSCS